ncbi:hypothetical protein C6502_07335 [Candidatus Poribacteria bacterium]|nr:MAG: hypothetical protein C6502_07335 [Candidatus Poribacteria bacterium]
MTPTNGIPQAGVRVLVRYSYGFAVAESGDTMLLLSKENSIDQITFKTETQRRQAVELLCALAEGRIRRRIVPVTWIDPEIQSFHPALALLR